MVEQAEAALRKQRKQSKEEFTDADTATLDNVSTFTILTCLHDCSALCVACIVSYRLL
jgi:hypothetical protein